MSEANEDTPISSLHLHQCRADDDSGDEVHDFRFLSALTKDSAKPPKRGEKDFEPHGTKHQSAILEASRQAMYDVLQHTRSHAPNSHVRAYYYGEGVGDADEFQDIFEEANRGKGLGADHIVMVENVLGTSYRTLGKQATGNLEARGKIARVWLLPEEALYLLERGNLDLRWPGSDTDSHSMPSDGMEEGDMPGIGPGVPMSLQAAYAMLVGRGTQKWKIDMDRYAVYANLKRAGYAVLRAPQWDPSSSSPDRGFTKPADPPEHAPSVFARLWGHVFGKRDSHHVPCGPLIQPGIYRSHATIFRRLSVIPLHQPHALLQAPPSRADPFRVVFHVWKASDVREFKKTQPGAPDYRVAVVSARDTGVPTMTELTRLLESTPFEPPPTHLSGAGKSYQRIKHGYRNVVLAIVDQGVVSYLRVSESAFGEEKLYERTAAMRGGKGGGRGGSSRGKGRGRGGRR